jgi:prepilin-type N-terminal cleavage/methylation domain-containing protein
MLNRRQSGFSMLELLVVIAILLIVTALAVPMMSRTIANYRLDAGGHSTASLIQQARLMAVKTNQVYYVNTDTSGTPDLVYLRTDTGARQTGDPTIAISNDLSFQTSSLPNHQQLDDYVQGTTSVLQTPGTTIGFTARGLPCIASTTTPPCQQGVGFEWFIQSNTNTGWEAVTVTPAGRIKSWRLNQLDSTKAKCGYLACWQ